MEHELLMSLSATCHHLRRIYFSWIKERDVVLELRNETDIYRAQKVLVLLSHAPRAIISGPYKQERGQKWAEQYTTVQLTLRYLLVKQYVDPEFFNILPHCLNLQELRINQVTCSIKIVLEHVCLLTNLSVLLLPEEKVEDPLVVAKMIASCNLRKLTIRYDGLKPHFWVNVVNNTPKEKIAVLKKLYAISYGGFDDSDEDINEIVKCLPQLRNLNFKGTVDYNCLESFYKYPNSIKYLALPWPQKDYSELKKKFIVETEELEGLQVQSRDDELLTLLAKHHGKSLRKLHLACTEGVTTDAIIALLRSTSKLVYLSLYFYDGHILNSELLEVIRDIPRLKKMWLGSLASAVVLEPLRIVHDNLQRLIMSELSVNHLDIECPNLKTLIPPILILDPTCAQALYAKSYPNQFIIRITNAEEGTTNIISISDPSQRVSDLIERIKEELGKSFIMSLIVNGKALKKDAVISSCLTSGCLVKVLA
jgi:hypothetical protein